MNVLEFKKKKIKLGGCVPNSDTDELRGGEVQCKNDSNVRHFQLRAMAF